MILLYELGIILVSAAGKKKVAAEKKVEEPATAG